MGYFCDPYTMDLFRSALLLVMISSASVHAQDPVSWEFRAEGSDVLAQATVQDGWHIYATELPRNDGPFPTVFSLRNARTELRLERIEEPVPVAEYDPNFAMDVLYHSGRPLFRIHVAGTDKGSNTLKGTVEYMVCNDVTCLPPKVVPFTVELGATEKK